MHISVIEFQSRKARMVSARAETSIPFSRVDNWTGLSANIIVLFLMVLFEATRPRGRASTAVYARAY